MAKGRTDTDRINWLEKNFGIALLDDDNGHWAISGSGMQNVPDGDLPQDIWTSFHVRPDEWTETVRAAIDRAMGEDPPRDRKKKVAKPTITDTLKPCPFCGGGNLHYSGEHWRMRRACDCGAVGPESDFGLSEKAAKKQANERWNAREARP